MTVLTTTAKAGPYAGAGTTGPFTVPFRFLDAAHLRVIRTSLGVETVLVLGTDYTVSGVGGSSGSVTLTAPLPVGQSLTVVRSVPATQEADYVPGDAFPAESHEEALDKLTMLVQQNGEELGRSLRLPASAAPGVSTQLPSPQANRLIGWNAGANGLQNLDPGVLATLVAYGTAKADSFTGDGVTTAFSLTEEPGSLNNLDVSVNGLTLVPVADYTWISGTVVTFTAPPANGAEILIRYMQGLPFGTSDSADVRFLQAGGGAVPRTAQAKLRETVSVKDFGAVGDGVMDDTAAIAAAHATGKPVFYPYGTYKHVGYFPECEGGIIGEGWTQNVGGKRTRIVFFNCTDPTKGAITPKQTSPKSNFFRIEHIEIVASSWDATTGCLGYGLDIGAPVHMTDVYVGNFKRSNIFFHHVWPVSGAYVTAPYESILTQVVSNYSGEHGCLIGHGANVLTFINFQAKWNGAPSYGAQPSVAGNYDGMFVDQTADGNDITPYTPQTISIMGGDCSYNSRYGWNFEEMADSASVFPGYAEGNIVKNARCGDVYNCLIAFSLLQGGTQGLLNQQTYSQYFYRNSFFIGGKQVHPPNVFTFIANPTQEDEVSGVVQNAPDRTIYFSRSNNGNNLTYIQSNATPDGTAVDKNTETVGTLRGFGTYALGIGSGSRHLRIQNNLIRLPDQYAQATGTGWNAGSVARGIGTAAPSSGTWQRGDIVYNSAPSASGYIGWVCVTSGTPGTWKGFGVIQA